MKWMSKCQLIVGFIVYSCLLLYWSGRINSKLQLLQDRIERPHLYHDDHVKLNEGNIPIVEPYTPVDSKEIDAELHNCKTGLASEAAHADIANVVTGRNEIRTHQLGKSKIAILSFYAPNTPYKTNMEPLSSPNRREYAEHHGYDYVNVFDHEELSALYDMHRKMHRTSIVSHYFKFKAMVYLFERYAYEWIMWCDGDAIFLNFQKNLTPYLDSDYDIIASSAPPESKKWRKIVNTGHFFVRNSEWSLNFLKEAYALSFVNCYHYLGGKPLINGWLNMCASRVKSIWHDQRIMQYFLSYQPEELYGCHFKFHSFRDFNSEFPDYGDGDLVVHFPGRKMADKELYIKMFINNTDFYGGGLVDVIKEPAIKPNNNIKITPNMPEYDQVFNKKCVN